MGLQILGNKLKRKRIGDQGGGMLELKGGGWSVGGNCRPMKPRQGVHWRRSFRGMAKS